MKKGLIKALSITVLVWVGLLAAPPALGYEARPSVESIAGAFTSGDRVHAVLRVRNPAAGRITLKLQGYSPVDKRLQATRVGARTFTILAGKSTYNGYFQHVSEALSGTDFTKFRIAIKGWTVDDLGGTSVVSNTFTRPTSSASPEPSPGPESEDDSTAAQSPSSILTDSRGLISAGDGSSADATGGSDGSGSSAVDSTEPPPAAQPRSQAVQQAAAPPALGAVRQPVSAKFLASPGLATSGGWIVLLFVPVVAAGAMFAALARS